MNTKSMGAAAAALIAIISLCGAGDGDALVWNEQALRKLEEKDYDAAIELLERAVAVASADKTIRRNLAVAHNNRGLRLIDSFEFGRAVADFSRAVKLVDDEPLFRVHLGYGYLKQFDFGRAAAVLEETRRSYPGEPKAYDYLGFLHYSDDELEKSIELWEQRLALDTQVDATWTRNMLEKAKRELDVSSDFVIRTNNDFVLKLLGSEKNLAAADAILAELESARARIGSDLSWFPQRRTIVLLYTAEEFHRATGAHEWVGGLYDGKIRLQVRDFTRQKKALFETIRHEYTHRVLAEMAPDVPIWMNEGLAEWYGNSGAGAHDEVKAAAKAGKVIPAFSGLPATFSQQTDADLVRVQYAASFSFLTFLRDRYGIAALREILLGMRRGQSVDQAMSHVIGGDVAAMEALWRHEILS